MNPQLVFHVASIVLGLTMCVLLIAGALLARAGITSVISRRSEQQPVTVSTKLLFGAAIFLLNAWRMTPADQQPGTLTSVWDSVLFLPAGCLLIASFVLPVISRRNPGTDGGRTTS